MRMSLSAVKRASRFILACKAYEGTEELRVDTLLVLHLQPDLQQNPLSQMVGPLLVPGLF